MFVGQAMVETIGSRSTLAGHSASVQPLVTESLLQQALPASVLSQRVSSCLTFSWLNRQTLALSRTVISKHFEINDRLIRTTTMSLVLQPEQLQGFDYNPARLMMLALSEGALFLVDEPQPSLPEVELVSHSAIGMQEALPASEKKLQQSIRRAVEIHGLVAVVELENALGFLNNYFNYLPLEERLQTTFSIGAFYTESLPVKLMLLPNCTEGTKKFLISSQIRTIQATADRYAYGTF